MQVGVWRFSQGARVYCCQFYPVRILGLLTVVLSIQGNSQSRNIVVYNAVGSKVSSHRIEKGHQQIALTAPSTGIYLIELEGAGKLLKWVVE